MARCEELRVPALLTHVSYNIALGVPCPHESKHSNGARLLLYVRLMVRLIHQVSRRQLLRKRQMALTLHNSVPIVFELIWAKVSAALWEEAYTRDT